MARGRARHDEALVVRTDRDGLAVASGADIGRWEVAAIRHTDVRAWVAKLSSEVGATVTIRTFGVLASILDDAVFDGRISSNRAGVGRIGLPKKTRGPRIPVPRVDDARK